VRARGSKGCYEVNQIKTQVTPKASDGENNESDKDYSESENWI